LSSPRRLLFGHAERIQEAFDREIHMMWYPKAILAQDLDKPGKFRPKKIILAR
jgi:hypothetical protein